MCNPLFLIKTFDSCRIALFILGTLCALYSSIKKRLAFKLISIKPVLKQELIMSSFTCPLFPLQKKKLSNTWGHDSCSGIHPAPWSPVTTLTDFWAQARRIHQSGDKQPTSAHYVEILCAWVAMMVLCSPHVCVRSGHDCELGDTAVLRAITPPQSSVSTHCPLRSVRHLLTSRLECDRHFSLLMAPSGRACKGKLTQAVSLLRRLLKLQ